MKINFINLIDLPRDIQIQCRDWRNSHDLTKYFNIKYIDQQTHLDWLNSINEKTPKNIAFAIKVNEDFIGMIYLKNIDYQLKSAEIGIYIHKKDMRNKGFGGNALNFIISFSKNKFNELYLECFNHNSNAIHLYKKIGFKHIRKISEETSQYRLQLK